MIITIICCVTIGVFFGVFYHQLRKLKSGIKVLQAAIASATPFEVLSTSIFQPLVADYEKEIVHSIEGVKKTTIPASEFFTEGTVCKYSKCNMKLIESGAGSLVGLGLLGTFLGLTIGIWGFDSKSAAGIQASIQQLLDGMGTAFITSLFGMAASLVYTFCEKRYKNNLAVCIHELIRKLDEDYYVDDVIYLQYKQQEMMTDIYADIKKHQSAVVGEICGQIMPLLQYTGNEEGRMIPIANAVREILLQNQEQTAALKSFSTDLALELNNGFDESLSRQMQQRLIPLMENVDATTQAVVEHIDRLAMSVSNPAIDMMERVMNDLKTGLTSAIDEFKSTISKNTTTELENLALSLGSATKTISDFPVTMERISGVLESTISGVQQAVAEISNTSAAANSAALKQMQEQIVLATTSISEAIADVKGVMAGITQASEHSSNELMTRMMQSTEAMSATMQGTVNKITGVLQSSVSVMSEELTDKQTDLLAMQEGTAAEVKKIISELTENWQSSAGLLMSQTETVLRKFDVTLERMNTANTSVASTVSIIQQAQAEMTGTASNLHTISGDMRLATEQFRKGQSEYMSSISSLENETKRKLNEVMELMQKAGTTTDEYAEKFEIIRSGLGQIFSHMQAGLNDYSQSVRNSIQRYLELYTTNLTNTTDALASTIQQQNEMVEMLVDTVNRKR